MFVRLVDIFTVDRKVTHPSSSSFFSSSSDLNAHPPRSKIQQSTDAGESQTHPPPTIWIHGLVGVAAFAGRLPIDRDTLTEATLDLAAGARSSGSRGRGRIEGRGWEHLWGSESEVHRIDRRAVELGKIQTKNVVVGVSVDPIGLSRGQTSLHLNTNNGSSSHLQCFALVVACVDRVVIVARRRQKLSSVNLNRCELQRSVRVYDVTAVLPLHNSTRAFGILCWL